MRNWVSSLLLVAGFPLTGCGVANAINNPAVDWEFVQAVGGLEVGTPYINDDMLWVPVTVDFSGRHAITTTPTAVETGLKCMRGQSSGGRQRSLLGLGAYEIEISFHVMDEDQPSPSRPFGFPDTCKEIPVPLPWLTIPLTVTVPIPVEPETVRVYYRDSVFVRHFIEEFTL